MNGSRVSALTPRQMHAMIIAMQVRNALEDFHAENLTNAQMKTLNGLIRYAIYDGIVILETMGADDGAFEHFKYLLASIPDYWEVPGRDERSA